jgi:hypothetical protein
MSAAPAVPREAAPVRQEWLRLAAVGAEPPGSDPAMVSPAGAGADSGRAHEYRRSAGCDQGANLPLCLLRKT